MVTFFCNNCGDYLKKKQAEMHGFCNDVLSCNDCKKDISGYEAIRGHTMCGQPVSTKKSYQPQNTTTTAKPVQVQTPAPHTTTSKTNGASNGHSHKNGLAHKEVSVAHEEEADKIEWSGFRNTLRRIVKRHPNKEIGKTTLKKKLRLIFDQADVDVDQSYDTLFEQNLQKTRNLQILGDKIRYALE